MKRKRTTTAGSRIGDAITGKDPELLATIEEEKQELLEQGVREALTEPGELRTIAEFKRRMDALAQADGYLNDFHRERSEWLMANLAKQPKATPEQA